MIWTLFIVCLLLNVFEGSSLQMGLCSAEQQVFNIKFLNNNEVEGHFCYWECLLIENPHAGFELDFRVKGIESN